MRPVIELVLPDDLKQRGVNRIAKEELTICVYHKDKQIRFTLDKKDITKTLRLLDKLVNGSMDQQTKENIKLCISENWLKMVGYAHNSISNGNNNDKNKNSVHANDNDRSKNPFQLSTE